MLKVLISLVLAVTGSLWALESNMFRQQKWNVEQLREAKQRRMTPTPKPTRGPSLTPTPTVTGTPVR